MDKMSVRSVQCHGSNDVFLLCILIFVELKLSTIGYYSLWFCKSPRFFLSYFTLIGLYCVFHTV